MVLVIGIFIKQRVSHCWTAIIPSSSLTVKIRFGHDRVHCVFSTSKSISSMAVRRKFNSFLILFCQILHTLCQLFIILFQYFNLSNHFSFLCFMYSIFLSQSSDFFTLVIYVLLKVVSRLWLECERD